MKNLKILLTLIIFAALTVFIIFLIRCKGKITDHEDAGGHTAEEFNQLQTNVFPQMDMERVDGNIIEKSFSKAEISGRNDWNLWTGGSQYFLDRMARESFGLIDVLKILDSRNRETRFKERGLINEPGFKKPSKPDKYGLYFDVPDNDRERGMIDELIAQEGIQDFVYGRSTGILGLRLYPNPKFDEEAEKNWDAEKYYNDEDYSVNPKLVRPYIVGMTCGICHITHHPLNPPKDPEAPHWENLVSGLGNQYFREGKVFANNLRKPEPGKPNSFLWEMLNAQPPGTSDTSRIATDHINNPNAINAIFNVQERLGVAVAMGAKEEMSKATLHLQGDNQPGDNSPLRMVPHILKDGADSIGVPGATIRVYINIGMFSQKWLELHKPLIGVKPQKPFQISYAQENSVYWMATQDRLPNIKAFLSSIKPMLLKDAPGGDQYITKNPQIMRLGKLVYAENCATCHSSKLPDRGIGETWTDVVLKDDFLENNFLSNEKRIEVSDEKLATNAARALGTNAKKGHIWDNFSSETYKNLPSVGAIQYYNPFDGTNSNKFQMPAGGQGRYRVPSLISIWTSAPFLHNNGLGKFTGDPSVVGRLEAFNDAVEKLLWPEKRLGVKSIWRTTAESNLEIRLEVLPKVVQKALKAKDRVKGILGFDRPLIEDGFLRLGPIPKGTPINLLGNLDLALRDAKDGLRLADLTVDIKKAFLHIQINNLKGEEASDYLKKELAGRLLAESNCPDFVVDRGHYYGTELKDGDKQALIEFLKTL